MLRKFLFFLFDGRHHSSQTVGRGPCLTLCSPSLFFFFFFLNCKCEATPLMDFQERNVVPLLCLIGFQLLSWVFFVFSFFCVFVCLFVSWCTKCFQLVKRLGCRQASSASTMSCGCIRIQYVV